MRIARALYALLIAAYAVLWIGGIFAPRPGPPWAAPLFLLLAALLASAGAKDQRATLLFSLGGFAVELIGVHTGIPFGSYRYSAQLGPSVAAVPIAIAFAWLTLLLFARDCAWRLTNSPATAALTGASLMTALDLLLDPVATRTLHFWTWTEPGAYFGVPLTNFAGWFTASATLLALAGKPPRRAPGVLATGLSVILFFALTALS